MSQEEDSLIRKKVFWYIAGILAFLLVVVMAQYTLTGTVVVCSGAVIGIMIAKIRQMTVGYDYRHPLWVRSLLIITGIIVISGVMIGYHELSKLFHDSSYYNENDIIGTWVITNGMDEILGVKPTEETFKTDGSWQSGSHDGILSKGRWTLKDDVIKVHQTTISVGSTHKQTDDVMLYSITHLTAGQMECKRGEYTIVFQRKK